MNRHLTGVMVAVFAAAMLYPAPVLADHRPGNVVVIGYTISQTGSYAVPAGRNHNARKLYVDELNARGGLLGHKVVLKIYDDKSDVRTAIELYEKLITEDKVDLVLGPYGSKMTDPVANVMERYKRPFVAHASARVIYQRGRKYIFSEPSGPNREREKGAVHLAKKIGVKRIAMITQADHVGWLHRFLGAQEWAKKFGLNVVLAERYPKAQTDFAALLRKIEASGAEAIIAMSGFDAAVTQLRQLRELNINVKLFVGGSAVAVPQFVKELGSLAEYVVGFSPWEPKPSLGHPGMKEFIESYEKRYGVTPNYHAANGYAAMQILEAAVKKASSFEPEKLRNALASGMAYSLTGPYKPNEQGYSTIEGVTFQIRNGKHVIVWPEYMAEAKFLPMPRWEDRAKK